MSQTKPLGLLLATLVLFCLYINVIGEPGDPFDVSYNDRFGPAPGDQGFGGPGPLGYDEEEDEEPNFFRYDDDFPMARSFSDDVDDEDSMERESDYPEDEDDESDEYEDDYRRPRMGYRGDGNRRYGSYSRYNRDPYRRRSDYRSRDWYDDDDDDYPRWRRRDPYRRYGSDSDDRYYSRNEGRRNDRWGDSYRSNRGRDSYDDGGYGRGGSRYGSSSRGQSGRYGSSPRGQSGGGGYGSSTRGQNGGGSKEGRRGNDRSIPRYPSMYGKGRPSSSLGEPKGSSNSSDGGSLREVADRVRTLVRHLTKEDDKKEAAPVKVVNA